MAKSLVIVESPAKAKTIKKFLGRNYIIEASVGHVIDLPKSKLGVNIEKDFEPEYITIRGKGPVLKELRKQAKKASKVYLATDPDREGEAISWHLAKALSKDQENIKRIEFNEITKNAVKKAIKEPREINENLVDAQQARRVLDRLVGYKISPLLWQKIRKGLSAGRVQSVASKMIKEREEEINAFVKEEYWSIEGIFLKEKKESFEGKFHSDPEGKKELKNKDEVDRVLKAVDQKDFEVTKVKTGQKRRSPQKPFTTSSLQQEASNKMGFSTKKTMSLAQQLYEGIDVKGVGTVGLVTYIRTDSTRMSKDAAESIESFIKEEYGDKYLDAKGGKASTVNRGGQDAHEAIRPTDVFLTPSKVKGSLKRDQYRLYKMIWERTVASKMEKALFNTLAVDLDCKGYVFTASGSQLIFKGFMEVYSFSTLSEDTILPEMKEGEKVKAKEMKGNQHFTQPPARYTEASLVKAMEELGIGRPSTYSPTISTILTRGYVERDGRYLVPTELGVLVTETLDEFFSEIIDVNFTAELENRLDKVEEGTVEWKTIIGEFYKDFSKMLENAEKHMEEIQVEEKTGETCEKCGGDMMIKYGRFGKFIACSNYPECKNTKPIVDKIGVKCPQCEKGEVIKRRSKKGRLFYGCDQFPECRFVSWNPPVKEPCPKCGSLMVLKKTKKEDKHECTNKECGHTEILKEES